MKIQANAVSKLQYFFTQMKWSRNCPTLPNPITEEIIEELFRTLGVSELATISLFTFKENTLAVRDFDEGFTEINMEFFAKEFDDYIKFRYSYFADPVKMFEKEETVIDFDGIRHFNNFYYDFETKKWKLSNY